MTNLLVKINDGWYNDDDNTYDNSGGECEMDDVTKFPNN